MLAHHGTYETNGRGGLHCHFVCWVRAVSYELYEEAAQNPAVLKALIAMFESCSRAVLPHPPGPDELFATFDKENDVFKLARSKVERPLASAMWPPVPERPEDVEEAERQCAYDLQRHEHMSGCFKYDKEKPAAERSCRMHYPRELTEKGHIGDNRELYLSRNLGLLVNYHPGIVW